MTELGAFLEQLRKDEGSYAEYFRWHQTHSIEEVPWGVHSQLHCHVCDRLWRAAEDNGGEKEELTKQGGDFMQLDKRKFIPGVGFERAYGRRLEEWWKGPKQCTNKTRWPGRHRLPL